MRAGDLREGQVPGESEEKEETKGSSRRTNPILSPTEGPGGERGGMHRGPEPDTEMTVLLARMY